MTATVLTLLLAFAGPPALVWISQRLFGDAPAIPAVAVLQIVFCAMAGTVLFVVTQVERQPLSSIGLTRPGRRTVVTIVLLVAASQALSVATGPLVRAFVDPAFLAAEDAGATWRPSNRGIRAVFLPDKYPEFGQCVHKIAQSRARPDRFYLQNHWGLYRSDDRGETWTDVANGVPSDFGFPLAIHPRDPDTAWIVPLESDEFRCTLEGKLRVFRTSDAGASWRPLDRGLPQADAYETVCATRSPRTRAIRAACTSARAAASCSRRRTRARVGRRSPKACRRSSPSRPR